MVVRVFPIHCIIVLSCFWSCDDATYTPKPKGYHRIELPKHEYVKLQGDYPYTFEYSKYAQVFPDTSFMTEPYWIDLHYKNWISDISISYKNVNHSLDSLIGFVDTSHRLTSKHQSKATAIDEYISTTPKGYSARVFELSGEVPSVFQAYVTDSVQHFLRFVLYFQTASKNDSLAPIIEYIKYDVIHMLNTLEWKRPPEPKRYRSK